MFPLAPHTIFLALAGSHAHGTARDGSDIDLRGVCVVPLRARLSLFSDFEQYEGPLAGDLTSTVLPRLQAHPTASRGLDIKTECVIYDVAKFIGLCAGANPNALEILFADEGDCLFETPAWRSFQRERHQFLTKKVQHTFLGYAMAQLKRIKTHRSWLLHPPARKPSREDFGLSASRSALSPDERNRIEQSIADKIRSYGLNDVDIPKSTRISVQERMDAFFRDVLSAADEELEDRMRAVASHALGLPADLLQTLNAEKRYHAAMKDWESYQNWKRQRNPARANLEREHGYDTKHAMHLVRLMRMGLEVLEKGELVVRRPDAAELNAIRDGALTFDELMATADRLREAMAHAAATSPLPADIDREQVDRIAYRLMSGA